MTEYKSFIEEQARIFKALGHPTRLTMVNALRTGEKCVCELQALIGDDMSTVSKHLSVLRTAGIVASEKRGTNIYYHLIMCCLDQFLQCTADIIRQQARAKLDRLG
ncbi:metalloregulator ArsR/SmtB family transcription factor [Oxalobacter aliiformigenes]|uniref:ArsR/SmtB family transcription factor n=1 Tax=Oxalobacter aliiformigenes TaxID=2946593 RepID=UPI0022B0565B|nr:metalloregulator ArsR/SmtB family transcription factor [Oxalobacter aliiformigenes]MCZ4065957.1 metalloregulator ArsR/SmtB family transcription factor [Oxalobacter aliiformigenes]WAW00280.1 metalloregulator ArsR/SmtB family transcription factor [Oxalobacter aliiformigenes]